MPLPGYGLLIGKIIGSRPPRKGKPHWVLFVQPGDPDHPPYRAAVNFQPAGHQQAAMAQYQIVDFPRRGAGAKLIGDIEAYIRKSPAAFVTGDSDPTLTFDFYSVQQSGAQPDDSCVLNLKTRKIL